MSGLTEGEDEYILDLLQIQASAFGNLERLDDQVKVKELIHETYKRWKGDMDCKTQHAKKALARALLKSKKYDEAFELLTHLEPGFELNEDFHYYCGMVWLLLDSLNDNEELSGTLEWNDFKTKVIDTLLSPLDPSELKKDYVLDLLELKDKW